MIAAAGGYKTDRQGDIVGKGHATCDVVEWLFPPLWPWKMISLPARGPRPTFKGEELLTLRLMDDVVVPKVADVRPAPMPGWHYFGQPSAFLQNGPQSYNSLEVSITTGSASAAPDPLPASRTERLSCIVLKSNEVLRVTSYRIDDGHLNYVLYDGTPGSAEVDEVDWTRTSEMRTAQATGRTLESRAY